MTRRGAALENLDRDHATAAARAEMRWSLIEKEGVVDTIAAITVLICPDDSRFPRLGKLLTSFLLA